jgi:hypothetical protein
MLRDEIEKKNNPIKDSIPNNCNQKNKDLIWFNKQITRLFFFFAMGIMFF